MGASRHCGFVFNNSSVFVLALAFIHHLRISSYIPLDLVMRWMRKLSGQIIIEFVTRDNEMVTQLLRNRVYLYHDYSLDSFSKICCKYFEIVRRQSVKGGKRELFHLKPKPGN